jgi:DNA-binding NarL/FixJ family response regulator
MAAEKYQINEIIRVLVKHDVRLICDGIESLLGQLDGLAVIKLPSAENMNKIKQEHSAVDVVLAVSELANSAAADHIKRIKSAFPGAKVVIIGVSGTEKENLEYIEAGALGYVLPDIQLEHLIETIQMVHRGEASCPPAMMARLFERIVSLKSQLQVSQNIELNSLTRRELEVLQLVAGGMSNKEIAMFLKLELQTVKNHIHSILEKLQVNNRWEAVACKRKIISIETNIESLTSPPSVKSTARFL